MRFVRPASRCAVSIGLLSAACNLTKEVRTTPGDPGEITTLPTHRPPIQRDSGASTGGEDGGGSGGASGLGGTGGMSEFEAGPKTVCGNGILEFREQCDGKEFSMGTCQDYGFQSGTLKCNSDCTVDKSGCSGTEICDDGRDNDGDGLVDCDDPDCAKSCKSACDNPQVEIVPSSVFGDTTGLGTGTKPSCVQSAGPYQVYQVTTPSAGYLEVTISNAQFIGVSIRTKCDDATTELGCDLSAVSVKVTAGQTVFVIVQGFESGTAGAFEVTFGMVQ